ncbi:MAG: Fic family protein [Cyclobacteriaceae bacterium]
MNNNHFTKRITVLQGRTAPEEALLVGYGALISALELPVPMPQILSLISDKSRQYQNSQWQVFSNRYLPEDTLYKQLVFALKYEGVDLLVMKKLFEKLTEQEVIEMLSMEPTGQYSRKLWFLYEWLLQKKLKMDDLSIGNYVPLVDSSIQFALSKGVNSARHRIINNLPGTVEFCPLIRKTRELEKFIEANVSAKQTKYLGSVHKDVLQRASAFLLLKDSKASFTIEGESPKSKRAARWGAAIGQAGMNDISVDELNRLQRLVIENARFMDMGLRKKGGFVGEHDRTTGEPIPDHVSARWQDLNSLMNGLIETNQLLLGSDMDAVLVATSIAFGFVFIHPFEDGNGRIHRYLIHHVLAKKKFAQQGIIFPVSASILDHIDDYRTVLESYSKPLLDFIDWTETPDHNVEVRNETIDYYRYFDATAHAEFLYSCVKDTIENIIPKEVSYLIQYDTFKKYLDDELEMPDKTVALLVRFLEQNDGIISKLAREKEFSALSDKEIKDIETKYQESFGNIQ